MREWFQNCQTLIMGTSIELLTVVVRGNGKRSLSSTTV